MIDDRLALTLTSSRCLVRRCFGRVNVTLSFLCAVLLILASQRIETAASGLFWGAPHTMPLSRRGSPPSLVEWLILAWVSGGCIASWVYFLNQDHLNGNRSYFAEIYN